MDNLEAKHVLQRDLANSEVNRTASDSIEATKVAIQALGAIDQIRWERDVALSQLEELGLGLGEKVKD